MLNLDTHILIHAVEGKLTPREEELLARHQWSISGIVLWEISKLSEKKKIEIELGDFNFIRTLSRTHIWPIDLDIARQLKNLDFKSDPADELIAATSIVHRISLLTRDKKILKSKIVPLA